MLLNRRLCFLVKGTAEPLVHFLRIIRLRKLSGKYYDKGMKLTKKLKQELMRELAASGGRARAKKYDKATLRKWAKKGGRPRKDGGK